MYHSRADGVLGCGGGSQRIDYEVVCITATFTFFKAQQIQGFNWNGGLIIYNIIYMSTKLNKLLYNDNNLDISVIWSVWNQLIVPYYTLSLCLSKSIAKSTFYTLYDSKNELVNNIFCWYYSTVAKQHFATKIHHDRFYFFWHSDVSSFLF